MVRIFDKTASDITIVTTNFEMDKVAFAERKDIGYPDTLPDNLAEYLSSRMS